MPTPERPAARGRPRTITREKICEAGQHMGLPHITLLGVAGLLGVSHMALYKHVGSVEELKHWVAQSIFKEWQLPQVQAGQPLKDYLVEFTQAVRDFIKRHPGVTPYIIRRAAATPDILEKIRNHQRHVAAAYGLGEEQARWLLSTLAFHCMAVAETVYSVAQLEPVTSTAREQEEAEMEQELQQGMLALIVGALATLEYTA